MKLQVMREREALLSRLTYGIELEGGWDELCQGNSYPSSDVEDEETESGDEGIYQARGDCHEVHDDGSVNVSGDELIGEVVSPREPLLTLNRIAPWIRRHYPDHVNSSCGLHIHIGGMTTAEYSATMHPAFLKRFIAELSKWGETHLRSGASPTNQFFLRLRGENNYCTDRYSAELQAGRNSGSARYAILNWCYHRHQTLEIRVLPMFLTATTANRAVAATIEIAHRLILQSSRRLHRHGYDCVASSELVLETPGKWTEVLS